MRATEGLNVPDPESLRKPKPCKHIPFEFIFYTTTRIPEKHGHANSSIRFIPPSVQVRGMLTAQENDDYVQNNNFSRYTKIYSLKKLKKVI